MITSVSNERVKHVAALQQKARQRREEGLFAVEGSRLFLETPESLIKEVYVTESFLERMEGSVDAHEYERSFAERARFKDYGSSFDAKITEKLFHIGFETVSEQVFSKMSDTKAPQGILAVLAKQEYKREELFGTPSAAPLLLLLENIQDPGNLGTILRAAEGAGVTGVILSSDCADIYQPKAVRSTMGSLFRVPFYQSTDLYQEIDFLKQNDVKVYAAYLQGSACYDSMDYLGGSAFLIGNEGNGLTREAAVAADMRVRIPMEGRLESLNAAVSAALLVYEAARQRRNSSCFAADSPRGE